MSSILLHDIFMKDDVKVKVPNGTPKSLILSDGVLKFGGKVEGDHAMHL
jgi:hypothetical protein